jgi:hypothetical protein
MLRLRAVVTVLGLIIGLLLQPAQHSVLPLEQNGAQFCQRFWRSCCVEAKWLGFKRFPRAVTESGAGYYR